MFTQLYEHFTNNDRIGGMLTMNSYVLDNCVTRTHVCMSTKEMIPPKKQGKGKKDFIWTDDDSELLLNIIHDYKVQQ